MTNHQDPFADFDGVVRNLEEIRAHIGEPPPPVLAKVMDYIDDVSRKVIEKSPFIVLASDTAGIAEAMIAHAKLDTTPAELKARMDKDGITQLY